MLWIGSSCPLARFVTRFLPVTVLASLFFGAHAVAQTQQLPYMNASSTSVFAQIDFAQMISDEQAWDLTERNLQTTLIDSGVVSALDLQAPDQAIKEFRRGTSELKAQDSKSAIQAFLRAVKIYPDFVSAHNALGLAYLDQQDARARQEFEMAAKLDDRFPGPFLNLGLLAITANDFATAEANLLKAANLTPDDARVLAALAFAENGNHQYAKSMQTVNRVHALEHHGFANVHYIAAAAAMSLHDLDAVRSQLQTFLAEDPSNPLSAVARQQLEAFAAGKVTTDQTASASNIEEVPAKAQVRRITFPNSEYLRAQLNGVGNNPDPEECDTCSPIPDTVTSAASPTEPGSTYRAPMSTPWQKLLTIHQAVDETALFFSVTSHGHTITDLSLSDIHVSDDKQPPDKVLQFIPQSRLPLRLGLLIDTSESVQERVTFEKRAAEEFIDRVLNKDSDLAFVEGFQNDISVTQDFTRDPAKLAHGIEKLTTGGSGTAIFDAVFLACWKLAAYPDQGRTARVLVVVTDGEDNSSHRSLKQAVEEAEAAGVTVYTISTAERGDDTDANRILKILAERTGGESFFPGNLRSLDVSLNELPSVIRSRYLIAYKAARFKPDGRFRRIHVTAEKAGRRLHVQVRKGYYARATLAPN